MPRPPRSILPGVAVHVNQRGNNRVACFRHESDYLMYLAHLRQLCEKYDCAAHAYCLMTNHVHLLLTPSAPGACTALMRDLGQRYVQYFNRRHERTGTLWEGRFGSCLVDSAAYVLGCYRYIELNPVRARMVIGPLAYDWSSARANTGLVNPDGLTVHAEYLALGQDDAARRRAYRKLLDLGDDPMVAKSLREATGGGYPLVGESLKTKLTTSGARVERGKPGPRKPKPSQ